MPNELTLVCWFDDGVAVPTEEDLQDKLSCEVLVYEEGEV